MATAPDLVFHDQRGLDAFTYEDGLGLRVFEADAATGDLIERLYITQSLTRHAGAIAERALRLANFRHSRFPLVHGVETVPGDGADRVAVSCAPVEGVRLSHVIGFAASGRLDLEVHAAVQLAREVLPALSTLHSSRNVVHGALSVDRLVLTKVGRVLITDHVVGAAIESLKYPRLRLWKEFRIAMPPGAGLPRFDERGDVAQVALAMLELILKRRLTLNEFPESVKRLLVEADFLPSPLRAWFEQALPISTRRPLGTALEAQIALEDAVKFERLYGPDHATLRHVARRALELLPHHGVLPDARSLVAPPGDVASDVQAEAVAAAVASSSPAELAAALMQDDQADEIAYLERELARLAAEELHQSPALTAAAPLRLIEAPAAPDRAAAASGPEPIEEPSTEIPPEAPVDVSESGGVTEFEILTLSGSMVLTASPDGWDTGGPPADVLRNDEWAGASIESGFAPDAEVSAYGAPLVRVISETPRLASDLVVVTASDEAPWALTSCPDGPWIVDEPAADADQPGLVDRATGWLDFGTMHESRQIGVPKKRRKGRLAIARRPRRRSVAHLTGGARPNVPSTSCTTIGAVAFAASRFTGFVPAHAPFSRARIATGAGPALPCVTATAAVVERDRGVAWGVVLDFRQVDADGAARFERRVSHLVAEARRRRDEPDELAAAASTTGEPLDATAANVADETAIGEIALVEPGAAVESGAMPEEAPAVESLAALQPGVPAAPDTAAEPAALVEPAPGFAEAAAPAGEPVLSTGATAEAADDGVASVAESAISVVGDAAVDALAADTITDEIVADAAAASVAESAISVVADVAVDALAATAAAEEVGGETTIAIAEVAADSAAIGRTDEPGDGAFELVDAAAVAVSDVVADVVHADDAGDTVAEFVPVAGSPSLTADVDETDPEIAALLAELAALEEAEAHEAARVRDEASARVAAASETVAMASDAELDAFGDAAAFDRWLGETIQVQLVDADDAFDTSDDDGAVAALLEEADRLDRAFDVEPALPVRVPDATRSLVELAPATTSLVGVAIEPAGAAPPPDEAIESPFTLADDVAEAGLVAGDAPGCGEAAPVSTTSAVPSESDGDHATALGATALADPLSATPVTESGPAIADAGSVETGAASVDVGSIEVAPSATADLGPAQKSKRRRGARKKKLPAPVDAPGTPIVLIVPEERPLTPRVVVRVDGPAAPPSTDPAVGTSPVDPKASAYAPWEVPGTLAAVVADATTPAQASVTPRAELRADAAISASPKELTTAAVVVPGSGRRSAFLDAPMPEDVGAPDEPAVVDVGAPVRRYPAPIEPPRTERATDAHDADRMRGARAAGSAASPRPAWPRTLAASIALLLLSTAGFAAVYWYTHPSTPGSLAVRSSVSGVEVFVDGKLLGVTPLTVDLPTGRHTIEMKGFGHSKVLPVEIASGVRTTQMVTWHGGASVGALQVTSTPRGGRVIVDGQMRGIAPLTVEGLSVGEHRLVVQADSGSVKQTVKIAANDTTEIDARIYAGWLTVLAPVHVQVFENGKVLGTSEDPKILLPPGEHHVELVNTHLGVREPRTVEVRPGNSTTLSLAVPEGSIEIDAPDGTEVWIDGRQRGVAPIGPVSAPIGTRDVVLRHPQIGQRRMTVQVGVKAQAKVAYLGS